MTIQALFEHPQALPTIPKVVQELIASFNDEDVSVGDITQRIATDLVLTAKLLRLANSAYYHASRTVSTVDDAVAMLGFVNVRTLVISVGLTSSFKPMPGLDLRQFWRHSLQTAVAARHLARQVGLNADLAFTVGLMHAIGQLVMHAGMPDTMLQLDRQAGVLAPGRAEAERAALGYSSAQVGGELARRWRFPPDFSQAIEACDSPLAQAPASPAAALIHVAAWCSRATENQLDATQRLAQWPAAVAQSIGLDADAVLHRLPPWEELCDGMQELIS